MRRLIFTLFLGMVATGLGTGAASAAPPSEDSLATPQILSAGTISGGAGTNNDEATFVGEPTPSCQHNVGHTVWWRYRPPTPMVVNLDTFGSDFDTVLAAYRSTANGLVEVACSDDSNGATSKIKFTAAEATSYYIQVGGFSALSGSIQFSYDFRLVNDPFAKARTISPGFNDSFNTAMASNGRQSGEPTGCTATGYTVWYRYTVSSKRRVTFDTFASTFDSQVAVWYGTSLAGLTFVGCADDTDETNGDGSFSWTAIPGRTYYIQVGGFQNTFGALEVNFVRRP
jgi:hypothetical protein